MQRDSATLEYEVDIGCVYSAQVSKSKALQMILCVVALS